MEAVVADPVRGICRGFLTLGAVLDEDDDDGVNDGDGFFSLLRFVSISVTFLFCLFIINAVF